MAESMSEIEIPHALEPSEVERRLRELAGRHDIEMSVEAVCASGRLAKKVPFLGGVEASYQIRSNALVVRVAKAPGALQGTLRATLQAELAKALA